jgi:hypothetical protein
MKKWVLVFVLLLIFPLIAQQIEPAELFKQKNAKNYWSYQNFKVKAIHFNISSPKFIEYMDKVGLKEMHYLQKIIWKSNGEFIFKYDSLIKKIPNQLIVPVFSRLDTIKSQFWGISFDLQSFLMENPLSEIPFDAEFWGGADTVVYQYETLDKGEKITVRRVFLVTNGLLLKQIVGIRDQIVYVYPHYLDMNEKWQCVGWTTQVTKNNQIIGGLEVRFDFIRIKDNFLIPEKIQMIVKVPGRPKDFFVSDLYLYKINVEYEQEK